jgi:CorA-like Mg2+ transporter protein
MTDDSTSGIRGIAGTGESLNDGKDDRAVPRAAICHVVHEEQVGELHLSRDNLEHLLASGSFFWIDLPRPREEDFADLPPRERRAAAGDLRDEAAARRHAKGSHPPAGPFASLMSGVAELPGMTTEAERHFRDVYDHLIRISDLIDTYRDLLTSSMDVFLSTISNRLNVVMKQLAVIATIFLPLTFITGFFGQNFGWLVRNIAGWPAFVGLGIGTEICRHRDTGDLLQTPRLVLEDPPPRPVRFGLRGARSRAHWPRTDH